METSRALAASGNVTRELFSARLREMQRPGGFNVTRQPAVSAVTTPLKLRQT